jgi:hypothetical protein
MGLETVTFIGDLVATNPTSGDPKNQGDDHLRNLKTGLLNSFAGYAGAILVTGTDGGAANAYTLTPTTPLPAYGTRMIAVFSPNASNTGDSTLNISGLGAKSIKSVSGATLVAGDLSPGTIYAAFYNGTEFRLLSITKNYVDQVAFSTALPAQSLGLLISNGTAASFSKTFTGFAVNTVRATVASDPTNADIWGAAGNEIDFTGGATVTNFPAAPVAGAERILHCAGAPTFTNNANISVQGAANYTAAAGDIVTVHAITTTTFRITIEKADGTPVAVFPPRGYINGFTLSNDGTSPNTVLDIAAGLAYDSTNTYKITGAAFTKSTAGSWAAGSGANGMGQGLTIANSTWYHVFAIINNGAFDVYFDTSLSAANKPANTTAFRRIGSFLTNGSANIVAFTQIGQQILWTAPVADFNGVPPTSATLLTLTIPPGLNVRPILSAIIQAAASPNGRSYDVWSPAAGSTDRQQFTVYEANASANNAGNSNDVISNTSKQIYHLGSAGLGNALLRTFGWFDPTLSPIA